MEENRQCEKSGRNRVHVGGRQMPRARLQPVIGGGERAARNTAQGREEQAVEWQGIAGMWNQYR